MFKDSYQVLGVMSGTSLDGIDLAQLYFEFRHQKWHFDIGKTATIPYDLVWVDQLKSAVHFSQSELTALNRDYTKLLGEVIRDFIESENLMQLDAVCSHGHTILHQPQNGFTLQIGNLPEIAAICRQTVVCDFRVQDVALGGQGAPLVPIGDRLLFGDYDYCLNLGGFSNVSFETPKGRIAFDISPVNTVLNYYANQLGLQYDHHGKTARSGQFHPGLFKALNELEYYRLPFPKSLGIEYVHTTVLPLMEQFELSIANKLHTFVRHITWQTALALPKKSGKLLATGGGAYHYFLMDSLQRELPELHIEIPSSTILEYKEALIFGLLGVLKLRNEINVLSSVTGASRDHCSGVIYEQTLI